MELRPALSMLLAFNAGGSKNPGDAGPTDLYPFQFIEHIGKVREVEIRILLLEQLKHRIAHLRFDRVFRLPVSITMNHASVTLGDVLLFEPDSLPEA